MTIRYGTPKDIYKILKYDRHISSSELFSSLQSNRVYVAEEEEKIVGWLRYNLFWDNTPFMNLLYVLEEYRGKGYGKALVHHWEEQMKALQYPYLMTSTASDEYAQHFYNKLGYTTAGGFTLADDPYELILTKKINKIPIIHKKVNI